MLKPSVFKHITCRNNIYPKSNVRRFVVPDEFVHWTVPYDKYNPPVYTAPHINGQVWADIEDVSKGDKAINWNSIDGKVNRESFNGTYEIKSGYPVNSFGRTGLQGRGLLGRWGPNHAADPVVTRWKRDANGCVIINDVTQKKILEMIVIQRHDNKLWAIPGGMVDAGETVNATLKREFMEEALNSSDTEGMIEKFFTKGTEIYKGYVDDFRNTDNAWMETVACNFHDEDGTQVGSLKLTAGDDAIKVRWIDINRQLMLHANHISIIEKAVTLHGAHW